MVDFDRISIGFYNINHKYVTLYFKTKGQALEEIRRLIDHVNLIDVHIER